MRATVVLKSLVEKGILVAVEVETDDPLTGKPSRAPAYRLTPMGFKLIKQKGLPVPKKKKSGRTWSFTHG